MWCDRIVSRNRLGVKGPLPGTFAVWTLPSSAATGTA
jgi:hypothetical protein